MMKFPAISQSDKALGGTALFGVVPNLYISYFFQKIGK